MYLTDEQIMLLEQLTYLTDDVADAAGVLLGPYDSVEDLLQQFDDDALQRLEDPGNPDIDINNLTEAFAAEGTMINSGKFDGMNNRKAIDAMIEWGNRNADLFERKYGRKEKR